MGSSFGTTLSVTIFGQSHSPAIGCVMQGVPSGIALDIDALKDFMARRAPGRAAWSTTRFETDEPHIVSGLNHEGKTCGAPLAVIIENANTRSKDYDNILRVPRPGHADFTAQAKWHGNQDVPGGGHFSGRLTAPLCAAGGIALQVLQQRGVTIGAHLSQIGCVHDTPFSASDLSDKGRASLQQQLSALRDGRTFPVIDAAAGNAMQEQIEAARAEQDSIGGSIECVATGMPAGIGGPLFDGIESAIARIAFGVPAVKALSFGAGSRVAEMRGSQNNDPYALVDGMPTPTKNDAGGNLGGITTGAPLVFRIDIKPTPSIAQEQDSVDLVDGTPQRLAIKGRHDPCIAPRAVPVAEAVMALALLDCWLSNPPEPGKTASIG